MDEYQSFGYGVNSVAMAERARAHRVDKRY